MKGLNTGILITFATFFLILTGLVSCGNSQQHTEEIGQKHQHTNLLVDESSPYLLQHAHNPVNWFPWGEAAFEKAKAEDKLVLISVGYSACHWCHVMEEESFEDSTIAAFMNENFVCIKVDREERPDVDKIYMNAVQLMNGSGGWPLNCFALPDGRPVYGGTYFPKNNWMELLQNLAVTYEKDKGSFEKYADNLTEGIQQSELVKVAADNNAVDLEMLDQMVKKWGESFDLKHGGPNRAPKFPLPNNYEFLMQFGHLKNNEQLLKHVDLTLNEMAMGGIYDQVGGGFARYSTDEKWKVPHFEKMLYDNAQLLTLYSQGYQRTKNPLYKKTVYQTVEWIQREMTTKDNAFYSALDADSEGEEGKFYVWTEDEMKQALTVEEFEIAKQIYHINAKGKWEGNYIPLTDSDKLKDKMDDSEFLGSWNTINKKLFKTREKRIRPRTDDKILTGWNAMTISGLVEASMAFNNDEFKKMALDNAAFLVEKQIKSDGGLWHTYKDGVSKIDGFLDDYAFVISAFLKLYELTFDESWLLKAGDLAEYAIKHFKDEKTSMFFYTSNSSESLIARKMETSDNVIPASNSEMANALFDLGTLLDSNSYKQTAVQMLANMQGDMAEYPSSFSNWGLLSMKIGMPYYEIAITGDDWKSKTSELNEYYIPNKLLMGGATGTIPLLEGKFIGETTIFVCVNKSCQMPVVEVEEALKQMEN
ncbi:MAG: thioredoxin domain-containing protein [Crocinitomicaceae bacterium]